MSGAVATTERGGAVALPNSVPELKILRDKLEALRGYARVSGEGRDKQNDIAEEKVRVEWKGGLVLRAIPREGGNRNPLQGATDYQTVLSEALLTPDMAHRWQIMSWLSEDDLTAYFAKTRAANPPNNEITSADVYRLGKKCMPHEEHEPPDIEPNKYQCIVIDPPWQMQKIERDEARNQAGFDYPTMTIDEITDAECEKWGTGHPTVIAAESCQLFMWTTQKYLPEAINMIGLWGFKYILTMVWHKPGGFQPFGLPQYNCEFIVFGRRGGLEFEDTKQFNCCFNAPRREHSRKPDAFYDLIRRVSPGPRIDVFSREAHDGFDQWGNQTEHFAEAS